MNKSIGKSAVWLTTTKLLSLLLIMAIEMILSRFRTLEEYGTYSQILLVVNLTITTLMLGLPNSINYFLAKADSDIERGKFVSNYYTLSTFVSLITACLLYFLSPFIISYFQNGLIKSFLFLLIILPWVKITNASIDNLLVVYDKLKILSVYRILQSLIMLMMAAYSVYTKMTFHTYMINYIVLEIISTFAIYIIVYKVSFDFKFYLNKKLTLNLLKFSIPLGLASIVSTLNIEISKLVVGKIFDTETLAVYTNAAREMPITFISASITAVLMPLLVEKLSRGEKLEAVKLWGEATTLSYILICSFAAFLFVYAPQVMTILYGTKYLPGVTIFRIYNVLLLVRVTYFGMILNSLGKTKFIFVSSILTLVLNVMLVYPLYIVFGISGPAIATVASLVLMAIVQLRYTSFITDINFKDIFPWERVFKITLINIGLGLLFLGISTEILQQYMINPFNLLLFSGVIWLVVTILIFRKTIQESWNNLKI